MFLTGSEVEETVSNKKPQVVCGPDGCVNRSATMERHTRVSQSLRGPPPPEVAYERYPRGEEQPVLETFTPDNDESESLLATPSKVI